MAEPTLVDYQQSTWTDRVTSSEVTASITWQTGDLIVVIGLTEDQPATLATPTASGLSFSLVTSTVTASNANAYVWKATAAGNGSGAITSTTDGSSRMRGLSAFVFRGSLGVGNTGVLVGQNAKVISLIRGSANSAVVVGLADWAAINDVAVTADPVPGGTQRIATHQDTIATMFVFDWTGQGAPGTTSYGIGSHTGTVDMSGIVVEILGTAIAELTGTALASITEADIVAGGKTIIITLTGDTWIAS